MAKGLGSLGDLFPTQDLHCRVRGCPNVWQFSGEDALHRVAAGEKARPARMCDDCFATYNQLQDQTMPCTSKDCQGTWTWTRYQQLEAAAQKRSRPPQGICEACRNKVREMADREIPCRVKGCPNTWTWTRHAQLHAEGDAPPPRMCRHCSDTLRTLQDQDIPCRMHGCQGTWRWHRFQQLEHLAAGKSLEKPPPRMCKDCLDIYRTLQDKQVPCKVDECQGSWSFNAFAQLEHLRLKGPEAELPSKMCKECYNFFLSSRDRQVRCQNRGCRNSWTYTRSDQLHDWLQQRQGPPQRMCNQCQENLKQAEDRLEPCMIPGCTNQWAYSATDQVLDRCQGRIETPSKRCPECETFLAENPTRTLPCNRCGADIAWSSYEQLLCRRGTFEKPLRCASCAEQELATKAKEPAPRPHFHVVKMPSGGKWANDPLIAAWPGHLDGEAIERAEKADIRIVAFGDDLTYSSDEVAASWPFLLEQKLNEQLEGRARVAVINSGIPKSTSRQALVRLGRDVAPFAPHLVVFSFAFADSLFRFSRHSGAWKANLELSQAAASMQELCNALNSLNTQLLYWSTNPILPHESHPETTEGIGGKAWADAQQNSKNQCLAHDLRVCHAESIPVLDLRSRFEVNGKKSARKWMKDWYQHNEAGSRNIATWMAAHILKEGLIPLP